MKKIITEIHWANETVLHWIETEKIQTEEILKLISHIVNAETLWVARILNKPDDKNVFAIKEIEFLREKNNENLIELKKIIQNDVFGKINYTMLNGTVATSTKEEIILHLFTHGFHHIGQIAKIASTEKMAFPKVSYLGFTWTTEYENCEKEI